MTRSAMRLIKHLAVAVATLASASALMAAPAMTVEDAAEIGAACRSSLAQAITQSRGMKAPVVEIARIEPAGAAAQTAAMLTYRGNGQYRDSGARAPVRFTFQCSVETGSTKVAGVVFRDGRADKAEVSKPWTPDLSNVSLPACNSAVAARLHEQYPHMAPARLESQGRVLKPGPQGRSVLTGSVEVATVPGIAPRTVRYACEFETNSGRVASVSIE